MKIKDIRQYRTVYKQKIVECSDSNRNEHFAGMRTTIDGKSEYGFFAICHGDKSGFNNSDGIRGFLEGFLDMAKDGQAVYEFLQNAVDAQSSKFGLFWGEDETDGNDYLLVVNNGIPFDVDSIRSILNVGVSTKSSDRYTIGKFGIGFKLAHRLVGRENGLDELINLNYGPVLFSWQHGEVQELAGMAENPEVFPELQEYRVFEKNGKITAEVEGEAPWLFKILVTSFPCGPENGHTPEEIYDCQHEKTQSAFSREELKTLGRWVGEYRSYLKENFEKGALFFIRLGQGKQVHLKEENLEEGVRFSLAILNRVSAGNHSGLTELNLNGNNLVPVPLEFESFKIRRKEDKECYRFIRFGKNEELSAEEEAREAEDGDIELLLGFCKDHREAEHVFLNAPNFYLFFPLNEEKHQLKFILHSNAFYKSSSRTYLQKGGGEGGINERLFTEFTRMLAERMVGWVENGNPEEQRKYLNLYVHLLESERSENSERSWINRPLYEPLEEFTSKHIPVKCGDGFRLIDKNNIIHYRKTFLPVDEEENLPGINWFYWNDREYELCRKAERKLGIKPFTIMNLLSRKDGVEFINGWLERNPEDGGVEKLLNEIDTALGAGESSDLDNTIKENLKKLKVWKFDEGFFSIEKLGEETEKVQHFLLFDVVDELRDIIVKAGWKVSFLSLVGFPRLSDYIKKRYQTVLKYLNNYDELIAVFNQRLPKACLSREEKMQVVMMLARKLSDNRADRIAKIKKLCLFRNRLEFEVALEALLKTAPNNWLKNWEILPEEDGEYLNDYFVTEETAIYTNVICPYWERITSALHDNKDLAELFKYVVRVYQGNSGVLSQGLSSDKIILDRKVFYGKTDNYFFSSSLMDFSEEEDDLVRSVLNKTGIEILPDYHFREFYKKQPFLLEERNLPSLTPETELLFTKEEIKIYLKLYLKDYSDLSEILIFEMPGQMIKCVRMKDKVFQVAGISGMEKYLEQYYAEQYKVFPEFLSEFNMRVPLNGDKLTEKLIADANRENENQMADLAELVLKKGQDLQYRFVQKFEVVKFDLEGGISCCARSFVRILLGMAEKDTAGKKLRSVAVILDEEKEIPLDAVHLSGIESVSFDGKGGEQTELHLSNILLNEETHVTKLVEEIVSLLAKDLKYDIKLLRELWGLSQEVEKAYIYKELCRLYKDRSLENAEQLAFICLYADLETEASTELFKVEMRDGAEAYLKKRVMYSSSLSLGCVPDSLVLGDRYQGIDGILLKHRPVFEVSGIKVVLKPYLENCVCYLPGIVSIFEEEASRELWQVVFELWQEMKGDSKLQLSGLKWKDIWGFDPVYKIRDDKYVVAEEKLPVWVKEWLQDNSLVPFKEKTEFLKCLGVSGPGSDILKIRKYLLGEEIVCPVLNYNFSEITLRNTFKLMAQEKKVFSFGSEAAGLLERLYKLLPADCESAGLHLPLISESDKDCFRIGVAEKAVVADRELTGHLSRLHYPLNELPRQIGKSVIGGEMLPSGLITTFQKLQVTFDILDRAKISEKGLEWEQDFYKKWKVENPQWKITLYPGKLPYCVKFSDTEQYSYTGDDEIYCENNEIFVNNERNYKSIIQLIESQKVLPVKPLERLKELFRQFDDSLQDFVRRLETSPDLQNEWKQLQEQEQQEQKKQELAQNIRETEPYSMKWFVSLLELMSFSDGGAGLENPQGDIIFGRMENLKDFQLIRLSDPSRVISPSIEMYSDFKATIHYTDTGGLNKSKLVGISGVSKKGSELIVMPAHPDEFRQIYWEGVKEIELKFIRSFDLTGKLTSAFKSLNVPEDYDFKTNLPENLSFIFGPPGTGKTTEISRMILEKMRSAKEDRILILTPTNKAADVLALRILNMAAPKDNPRSWLVRFGASASAELLDNEFVYDGNSFNLVNFGKCVFITTIQRFPYETVISCISSEEVKCKICEIDWDTIVFDEASMIMLPAIVFPLYKRRCNRYGIPTEFIIGGDPLQIPPVYDITDEDLGEGNKDVKEENIYTMIGLNSFDEKQQPCIPGVSVRNLGIQYRSIEPIGNIYSRFQYEGLLQHGRKEGKGGSAEPRKLPEYFVRLGFKPVTIIRYPVHKEDAIYTPWKLNQSPFHIYSAFLVNELIWKFRQETEENWQIGVISPYRAQATILNKLLGSHQDRTKLEIISDTVHGFQGDECDMVFAVFNPSSLQLQYSRFFKKEYILNVAVSRARDYLVILIPDLEEEMNRLPLFDLHRRGSLLSIIKELPEEFVADLKATALEAQLMGAHHYFTENSFVNAHQNVNVYGDLYKDYIVRYSNSAVDIHIKPK